MKVGRDRYKKKIKNFKIVLGKPKISGWPRTCSAAIHFNT